jgi:hypothetical protein
MYVSFILNAGILISRWISASKGCKNKLLRNVHEKKLTAYFEAFFPIYLQFFKKRTNLGETYIRNSRKVETSVINICV